MGRSRFSPMDLGARWIARHGSWERGSRVAALAGSDVQFERHLMDKGVEVVPAASIREGYVAGGFLLADANVLRDLIASRGLDGVHRFIFPFGKLLLAIQLPFAGNRGFSRVCEVMDVEKACLSMPADVFCVECGRVFRELAFESPAVLARLLCCLLKVGTEPSFSHCTVDRFIFDPDVMAAPMGWRVDSQAAAQHLASTSGESADRHGMLLVALSRTARV